MNRQGLQASGFAVFFVMDSEVLSSSFSTKRIYRKNHTLSVTAPGILTSPLSLES